MRVDGGRVESGRGRRELTRRNPPSFAPFRLHAALVVVGVALACGRTTDLPEFDDETSDSGGSMGSVDGGSDSGGASDSGGGDSASGGSPAVGGSSSVGGSVMMGGSGAAPGGGGAVPDGMWRPVSDPPQAHSDCRENLLVREEEDTCTYRLQCQEGNYWSHCEPGEDGQQFCSCLDYDRGFSAEYFISADEGYSACERSIPLCVFGFLPPTGKLTCELADEVVIEAQCQATLSCSIDGMLSNGLAIDLVVSKPKMNCFQVGDAMECDCGDDTMGLNLRPIVHGADSDGACRLAAGMCEGVIPEGTERECTTEEESEASDSCTLRRACAQRTDLAEGVYALTQPGLVSSTCTDEGGTSSCQCQLSAGPTLQFESQVQSSPTLEVCQELDLLCEQGEVFPTLGEVTCDDLNTGLNPGGMPECFTESSSCSQAGQLGTLPAEIVGPIVALCNRGSGTQWMCECRGREDRSSPFYVNGTQGTAVCPEAFEECRTSVKGVAPSGEGSSFVFD
jgi:hypothetical protein